MTSKFKTIGLLVRNDMQSRLQSIERVIKVLSGYAEVQVHCLGFEQSLEHVSSVSLQELVENAELVISLGGDGTLLTAARALVNRDTPLLGINLGRLGFLADVSFTDFESYLEAVMQGRYTVEKRFFIEGEFFQGEDRLSSSIALNDIILHSHETTRMIEYEVYSGGALIHRQRSDGVIVTTPTGSTAYALSGGGPIMHPSLETLAIVPICPHTLSNRPIVLPAEQTIEIRLGAETTVAKLSYDGQSSLVMDNSHSIRITRHPQRLTLLHPEDYDYFQVLRAKLYWSTNY